MDDNGNLGMHIIHIQAVFWKFAYPQFTGYAEYIRFCHKEHLKYQWCTILAMSWFRFQFQPYSDSPTPIVILIPAKGFFFFLRLQFQLKFSDSEFQFQFRFEAFSVFLLPIRGKIYTVLSNKPPNSIVSSRKLESSRYLEVSLGLGVLEMSRRS